MRMQDRSRLLAHLPVMGLCIVVALLTASYGSMLLGPSGALADESCTDSFRPRIDGDWHSVEDVARDTDLCPSKLHPKGKGCEYDAVVVLGGGPQSKDGRLPVWTERRCEAALQLQRCCSGNQTDSSPLQIITASAGSAHVPNTLDKEGFPVYEATASSQYLILGGIDKANIAEETASWDTIGNAWFIRIMHTDIRRWHRLLIITSDFHMPRSRAIFEWVMGIPPNSELRNGGQWQCPSRPPYTMAFLGVSDKGIEMVADRSKREAKSLQNVKRMSKDMRSMDSLHSFLYTEHKAYMSGAGADRLQGDLKKMYNG